MMDVDSIKKIIVDLVYENNSTLRSLSKLLNIPNSTIDEWLRSDARFSRDIEYARQYHIRELGVIVVQKASKDTTSLRDSVSVLDTYRKIARSQEQVEEGAQIKVLSEKELQLLPTQLRQTAFNELSTGGALSKETAIAIGLSLANTE